MRRRGCLIAVGVVAGLLLLCCVLAWFVAIPPPEPDCRWAFQRTGDHRCRSVRSNRRYAGTSTYTISIDEIQSEIDTVLANSGGASDFVISVDSEGISIGFASGSQVLQWC